MSRKTVFIAFLGNYLFDTRCSNLIRTLKKENYEITGAAFEWRSGNSSPDKETDLPVYRLTRRFRIFFYLKFIMLLSLRLLTKKADYYFAEDVYTLPFTVIAAKLRSAKVFYDSRELYAHLAGLKEKPFLQKVWAGIEKRFIKKADAVLVTGTMDGEFLEKAYGTLPLALLRNLPRYAKPQGVVDLRAEFNIPAQRKILLYQGAVLHGRGIAPLLKALEKLPQCHLLIFGSDDETEYFKKLAGMLDVSGQVTFAGRIDQNRLLQYTAGADVGTALIENVSISYYYALPNKLFEYIMAELPVIVSDLPQMREIITTYKTGIIANPDKTDELAAAIEKLTADENLYAKTKEHCRIASESLHWENEVKNLTVLLD